MRKLAAIMISAALFPISASAQNTSCFNTGYGAQIHLWCNTTSPPAAAAPAYSAAQYGFYSELGAMIGAAAKRVTTPAPATGSTEAQARALIDAFAATHPDLPTYRQRMAELFSSGRAQNLDDAYILARFGN